jgi:site-specific DNA-adenine methylase
MADDMRVTAILPYYGCDRMVLESTDAWLSKTRHLGVVFAGSDSIVLRQAGKLPTVLCNDLHRHSINLGRVIASPTLKEKLAKRLAKKLFHPDELSTAQAKAKAWKPTDTPDLDAATWYFISQWMGRSAMAGTKNEFSGGLSIRWGSGGGDSNRRYRSAVESLDAWHAAMLCCSFSTEDFRVFLAKSLKQDKRSHAIYCDPPFPAGGERYLHAFTPQDHRDLRDAVAKFTATRVLMRYYDHPRVQKLYADKDKWRWQPVAGRKSTNDKVGEVLITNILEHDT